MSELRAAHDAGVSFYVSSPDGGCMDLSVEQVGMFIVDPALVWSKMWEVSIGDARLILYWIESGGQCTGTTRKGRRCRIDVGSRVHTLNHKGFRLGIDDRCDHHVEESI